MIEIKNVSGGQVQIADEVIAVIAGTATLEADGVVGLAGNFTDGLAAEILGKKNFAKGVRIEATDDQVVIEINMIVRFGCKVHEVSADVQRHVKNAVETMTGLTVSEVNLNVTGIQMER